MQSIKPQKTDPEPEKYGERIIAWQKAFAFSDELKKYVNDLHSMISNAGQPHSSDNITVGTDFVKKLKDVLDSTEFQKNMDLAKPNLPSNDPQRSEKLAIWKTAFTFPNDLREFGKEIKDLIDREHGKIQLSTFLAELNSFIDRIKKTLPF